MNNGGQRRDPQWCGHQEKQAAGMSPHCQQQPRHGPGKSPKSEHWVLDAIKEQLLMCSLLGVIRWSESVLKNPDPTEIRTEIFTGKTSFWGFLRNTGAAEEAGVNTGRASEAEGPGLHTDPKGPLVFWGLGPSTRFILHSKCSTRAV